MPNTLLTRQELGRQTAALLREACPDLPPECEAAAVALGRDVGRVVGLFDANDPRAHLHQQARTP